MRWPRRAENRHCRRCLSTVSVGEKVCPECDFNPKDIGLRITGYLLFLVPLSWVVAMLLEPFVPGLTFNLMAASLGIFVLSAVSFVISMAADPYRFGNLFKLVS